MQKSYFSKKKSKSKIILKFVEDSNEATQSDNEEN